MILLGSKSLHLHLKNDQERFDKSDFDVVMSKEDFSNFISINKDFIKKMIPISNNKYIVHLFKSKLNRYEIEISFKESSKWLLDNSNLINCFEFQDDIGNKFIVPNIEILYLTKKSHINFPIHYDKNIKDYSLLSSLVDKCKIEKYNEYYVLRNNEVKERMKKKTPSLKMSNENFFDRSKNIVGYIFEHDDIHEAIKHFERPIYEMMKKDFSQAWCEKEMFENLPHDYKIKCVQEEAYVIALERYIILEKGNCKDYKLAYKDALQRICTTLCSGFFRDFAVNNYFEILNAYSENYVHKFNDKLLNGLIRKLEHVPLYKVEEIKIK